MCDDNRIALFDQEIGNNTSNGLVIVHDYNRPLFHATRRLFHSNCGQILHVVHVSPLP
jgi:hypothetical protein